MDRLKETIVSKGKVVSESVLKVDSFLNHQIDCDLLDEAGEHFFTYFTDRPVDRIMTVESSGIAVATACARYFKTPVVFAKKQKPGTMTGDVLTTQVHSFTKNTDYTLTLSKEFIQKGENILIVDDFLARGNAASGLADLVETAGAAVAGVGIVIEKGFQPGRSILENRGYDVYSLAVVESLADNRVTFQ